MANLGYDANGFYKIPNSDGTVGTDLYTIPNCNYAPHDPCVIKSSLWSEIVIESKAFNEDTFNWGRAMQLLYRIGAAASLNALDTNVDITAPTDIQKANIEDFFYSTISNI